MAYQRGQIGCRCLQLPWFQGGKCCHRGLEHPLRAVHVHEQLLHIVVGALIEHDVGEVEEVEPDGEQSGAHHGGLEPWAGETQEGELHVRVIHLRSGVGQTGGGSEFDVDPPQLTFPIINVGDENAGSFAGDAQLAGPEPGECAGDTAGGAGYVPDGSKKRQVRREGALTLSPCGPVRADRRHGFLGVDATV
jgi:hypothetical protein